MPIYCFRSKKTGQIVEMTFKIGSAPPRIWDPEHGTCERDIEAEHKSVAPCHPKWPIKSDAAGCHTRQIPGFEHTLEKLGVPTKYDPQTGQAIFTDRAHRKKFLKATGMHDKTSYDRG